MQKYLTLDGLDMFSSCGESDNQTGLISAATLHESWLIGQTDCWLHHGLETVLCV